MEGDDLRVGFIGLGSQGGPMAQAIIDAGFATTLWARRPKALVPYRSKADLADSPADLTARSDMVGICVLSDADVEEVVLGPNGLVDGVRPGTVVAIHSTVHPRTCIQMASALAEAGADVLDAPVSGGGGAAAARKLLVMVGVTPPSSNGRGRCSSPSVIRSCIWGHSAADRRPSSPTTSFSWATCRWPTGSSRSGSASVMTRRR